MGTIEKKCSELTTTDSVWDTLKINSEKSYNVNKGKAR